MKGRFLILLLLFVGQILGQEVDFKFYGVKIKVDNLEESKKFYQNVLGLGVEEDSTGTRITGQTFPILIEATGSPGLNEYPLKARTGLTFIVDKLLPAIDQLRANHVPVYDTLLARNGVGISIPFQDPSGNVLNLIEVQTYNIGKPFGTKVYNTGVTLSNLDSAIIFYQKILGFEDWSRNYLPAALPLKHKDGSFAFMIHNTPGLRFNDQDFDKFPQLTLMLTTNDIRKAKKYLQSADIEIHAKPNMLICRDYEGNWLEIIGDGMD